MMMMMLLMMIDDVDFHWASALMYIRSTNLPASVTLLENQYRFYHWPTGIALREKAT